MTSKQVKLLLELFAEGKELGQLEAITKYGIGHLSSVVSRMVLDYGILVQKNWSTNNSGSRYVVYSMDKDLAKWWLENKFPSVKRS